MKADKLFAIIQLLLFTFTATACAGNGGGRGGAGQAGGTSEINKTVTGKNTQQMETHKIKVTVNGGKTFTATLADNSSAEALAELLKKGDLTIKMEDYGNMEKVGPIGASLPRNDKPTTTSAGDIILYLGTNITIYYDTNSWNFTRLGRIDNVSASELREALGKGDVSVTFSLN